MGCGTLALPAVLISLLGLSTQGHFFILCVNLGQACLENFQAFNCLLFFVLSQESSQLHLLLALTFFKLIVLDDGPAT